MRLSALKSMLSVLKRHYTEKGKVVESESRNTCYHKLRGDRRSYSSRDSKTAGDAVNILAELLRRKLEAEEAQSSADFIVAYVLGHKIMQSVKRNTILCEEQWKRMLSMTKARCTRMPLQYILGEWDFLDLTLKMKPPVLIPRPETEELVRYIQRDPTFSKTNTFLDIGSGSGAISVALLKSNLKMRGTAVDINQAACELTQENATLHQVTDRLTVIHKSVSEINFTEEMRERGPFDLIVSNPPYIPEDDLKKLQPEVKNFESHEALNGGKDGMSVINTILKVAPHILKENGSLWLEVNSSHPAKISEMYSQPEASVKLVSVFNDLYNRERFCHLKRKKD